MKITLGEKIRELRKRDGRTQEMVADVLGVSSQAVSRWESNGGYPDMEILPSIANYFGITIDELFGYKSDRDRRIKELLNKISEEAVKMYLNNIAPIEILPKIREAVAEYPSNEDLLYELANILSECGYKTTGESWFYDEESKYMKIDMNLNEKNEYWQEAIKILSSLIEDSKKHEIRRKSTTLLIFLYRNIGEHEKAKSLCDHLSGISSSSEIMLTHATNTEERARFAGNALIKLVDNTVDVLIQCLMSRDEYFDTDFAAKKISGAIDLYNTVFEDGNFGIRHCTIAYIHLFLSYAYWRAGEKDKAFEVLEKALYHANEYDSIKDTGEFHYTAPLFSLLTESTNSEGLERQAPMLPKFWPYMCVPGANKTKEEIEKDPRWNEWVAKTQK